MNPYFRERAEANALQEALERFETLVSLGEDPAAAANEVRASVPRELRSAFALATALPQARTAETPEPSFAAAFEERLRRTNVAELPAPHTRHPRFQIVLAAAAAIVVLAGVLVPALHSLPGDPLYALKTTSEDARALVVSGPAEARLRISFANERFHEVEQLVARSRLQSMGLGTVAASGHANIDTNLAMLIKETLQDAEHELSKAAEIITTSPQTADASSLERLVAVSQRGQDVAETVATVVPHADAPPVLKTVVKLARIEAQANAARMTVEAAAKPTPTPCVTPTPAPTATPDEPTATPTETPTPTPSATPESTPAGTATPGPCVTPTPKPSATPGGDTKTPEPSPEVTSAPTTAPAVNADGDQSGDPSSATAGSGSTDAMPGQSSG